MESAFAFEKEGNKVSSLNQQQRTRQAELFSRRFDFATTDLRILIEDSREGWDFYERNYPDQWNKTGSSAQKLDSGDRKGGTVKGLRLGLIPRAIDSVLALLHNAIFPADEKFFRGTPKNSVAEDYQEIYEQFRADNFAEDNATEQLRRYLLTLCIDPAAAVAVHWDQDTGRKVTYEAPQITLANIQIPLPLLGIKEKVNEDYVFWEGTRVECLDFNDWRVDTTAKNLKDSWFIRRWYLPCWQVEEEFGIKDVKPYSVEWEMTSDPLGNQKRESSGLYQPTSFDQEEEGKKHALLMICYDDFVIDGKTYKNHCGISLNGKDLIWFGPNPYNHGRIPYIVTSVLPLPNQIYGMSLIKHAIPSAAVVDTCVDKALKIAALAAEPIFEVDMKEPAFKKSRQVKAGMTVPVQRVGAAIRQVPIQLMNLSFLENIIQMCQENIREVTGANPMLAGDDFNQQPANVTAFQVDQHIQGASSRFQAIMNNFCNTVLDPLMYISFENDKQFKTKTEFISIGDKRKELTPDLIKQMEFKWLITSSNATAMRAKRLANLRSLVLEIVPQAIQAGLLKVSPETVELQLGKAFQEMLILGGEQDADKLVSILPPPPPMPQPGAINGLSGLPTNSPGIPGPSPIPAQVPGGVPGAPVPNAGPPGMPMQPGA